MKKYKITLIGSFHTNHNEDFLVLTDLSKEKTLIAVMDGCSMGKESHFASTLIGKILRKIAKEISYKAFIEKKEKSLKIYLQEVMENLFQELKNLKNNLLLETEELLSTLIIGIVDNEKRTAEILTIGDGLICCNGQYIEYEQGNKPDYLGYHLAETFEDWFKEQTQKCSLKNVEDLSISTDGIFTFKNFDNKEYKQLQEQEWIDFLLINKEDSSQDNMLKKKLITIENKWGLKPTDDLSIIRIICSLLI